jgi:NADH-quinone oxidoreductase subunit E/NADP-reducing hydrogenase subunit HndA
MPPGDSALSKLESVEQAVSDDGDGDESSASADGPHVEVCRDELRERLADLPDTDEGIIPALQSVQDLYGYLPPESLHVIAEKCGVSRSRVHGTATFYDQFYLEPRGDYTIKVCTGTACHVKGAGDVSEAFQDELGVDRDEVTPDGRFTIEHVRCVGACGLAPVIAIDDSVHGPLGPDDVTDVVEQYSTESDA